MAGKQLSIIVQAVDQATGPLRAIANAVLGIAATADAMGNAATKMAKNFVSGVFSIKGAIAALGIYELSRKLEEGFSETAKTLVEVGNAGKQLSVPVEALSELRYAAKLSDMDFQGLSASMGIAAKNIGQFALTGGGRAADAIKRLNIDLKGSDGALRNIGELLPEILDSLAKADPTERIYLAQKVFGEGGDKFLRFVDEGTNRLKVFNEEAKRLGVVFTPEQVMAAEKYRHAVFRVEEAWLGLKVRIFDAMGPWVRELVNKLASVVAAVPEMVGNISKTISDALGGGPGADAAQAKLDHWIDSLSHLITTGFEGAWRIVAAAVPDAIDVIGLLMTNRMSRHLKAFVETASWRSSIAYSQAGIDLAEQVYPKAAFEHARKSMMADIEVAQTEIDIITRNVMQGFPDSAGIDRTMLQTLVGNDSAKLKAVLASVKASIGEAGASFLGATNDVVDFTGALAKTSLAGLETGSAIRQLWDDLAPKGAVPGMKFKDIINGARDAATDLVVQANNVEQFVKKSITSVAESLSSGLATAIIDVVAGTKSLKKAFTELAASTLKQVAQMILQFEILRLVAGIAGAFTPQPTVIGSAGLGGLGGAGNPLGAVVANRGGLIGSLPHVHHFDMGGMVPGFRTHRDSVLAALTPGERVITERGVAATAPSVWDYANAGGRLAPAGSGGGGGNMSMTMVVNIEGGGSVDAAMLAKMQRASYDGWMASLANSPAKQAQLARMVRSHV